MTALPEILLVSLVAVLPVITKIIGNYLKGLLEARSHTLKVTSPTGKSITVELKKQMSKEEVTEMVKTLEEFQQQ